MTKTELIVWMDLEMTGLNPKVDEIVEIATVITDSDLNILYEGPDLVVKPSQSSIDQMGDYVRSMHTKSGLLSKIMNSEVLLADAKQATLNFLMEHVKERESPLAGNSIGTDRRFLLEYMPEVEEYLHYRSIDVSTIKELVKRWFPKVEIPKKFQVHRALDDIKESINELSFYRNTVFIKNHLDAAEAEIF